MEVILSQYNADKTEKIDKWESWKAKITSILVLNRNLLYEVKSKDPSTDPKKIEEQLAKAKVRSILQHLREIIPASYIDTALLKFNYLINNRVVMTV